MAHPWFRVWADMVNDPKWRTIARVSSQKIGDVIAAYVHMMTLASNATERGRTEGWNDEDIATALDVETHQITAIREAMQGRVLDGDRLMGWEKRQPLREDGSAERAKAHREAQKLAKQTQPNADERKRTLEEIRREETRKKNLPNPDGLGADSDAADLLSDPASAGSEDLLADSTKPNCPHQEIVALYHEVLPQCPQIRDWTPARAVQLRARWNEDKKRQSLDYWKRLFEYVGECDFLVGKTETRGRKPFFADLEWIVKSANFTKIREGKYAND